MDDQLGTDDPAAAGTTVHAVNDGTVVMAGMTLVRGNLGITAGESAACASTSAA